MCISDLIQLVLQQNTKASIAFITGITFLISSPTMIQHLKGKNAFSDVFHMCEAAAETSRSEAGTERNWEEEEKGQYQSKLLQKIKEFRDDKCLQAAMKSLIVY